MKSPKKSMNASSKALADADFVKKLSAEDQRFYVDFINKYYANGSGASKTEYDADNARRRDVMANASNKELCDREIVRIFALRLFERLGSSIELSINDSSKMKSKLVRFGLKKRLSKKMIKAIFKQAEFVFESRQERLQPIPTRAGLVSLEGEEMLGDSFGEEQLIQVIDMRRFVPAFLLKKAAA